MDRRRLQLLLVAWCVVTVLPGVLLAVGVFGDVHDHTPGGMIPTWFGAYLVQLGIFIVISKMTESTTRASWWLIVSLLPWVIDWVPVGSPWLALTGVAAAVGFAYWVWADATRADDLQRLGVRATGTVLEVIKPKFFNVIVNSAYIRRTLRLRIAREDGVAPYEATFKSLFMFGEIPDPGDHLRLRVDPKRPKHFAPDKDGDDEAAVTPAPEPDEQPVRHDAEARLKELARLRAEGLVTEAEYEAQRRAIISSV